AASSTRRLESILKKPARSSYIVNQFQMRFPCATDFHPLTRKSPCELHSKGRRHIPRQRHRVTNWREYDASLRNRGSLTVWFTPDASAGWKAQRRTTPGGQRHYSDLAIETALTLRAVFRLALRQSEGLIGSIMKMLEIDLPVPDHTTLRARLEIQTASFFRASLRVGRKARANWSHASEDSIVASKSFDRRRARLIQ